MKNIKKHTENGGWDNVEKSIIITDQILIHNENYKGYV
jgi:hypothetical protein